MVAAAGCGGGAACLTGVMVSSCSGVMVCSADVMVCGLVARVTPCLLNLKRLEPYKYSCRLKNSYFIGATCCFILF